ncbi:hypothetical protein FVE85_5485 [Porphyridium purpureum]|uniref:Anaphase-promoting complex subunit 4 n=1 Tax=Porphyridium purpureum TaxID=35688 RepID=A0A5J4Z3R0_PORPP|nr:hypothetical protein FVE85_5485 [Porphyridium purpureum]|eukprot:POR9479..scf295_1
MGEFRTLHDADPFRLPITALEWCEKFDLIAVATQAELHICRLGLQRLAATNQPVLSLSSAITCMSWSPDGRYVAVGEQRGIVHLVHVDQVPVQPTQTPPVREGGTAGAGHVTAAVSAQSQGADNRRIKYGVAFESRAISRTEGVAITAIAWMSTAAQHSRGAWDLGVSDEYGAYADRVQLLHYELDTLRRGFDDQPNSMVLFCGDAAGRVHLTACGLHYPFAVFEAEAGVRSQEPLRRDRVLALQQDNEDQPSAVAIYAEAGSGGSFDMYSLVKIGHLLPEILRVAPEASVLPRAATALETLVANVAEKMAEVSSALSKRMEAAAQVLKDYGDMSTVEEAFASVACGAPIELALSQAFTQVFSEQELLRLKRTSFNALDQAANAIAIDAKPLLHVLVLRTSELRALLRVPGHRFGELGFDFEFWDRICSLNLETMQRFDSLLVHLAEVSTLIANLLDWLTGEALLVSGEDAAEDEQERRDTEAWNILQGVSLGSLLRGLKCRFGLDALSVAVRETQAALADLRDRLDGAFFADERHIDGKDFSPLYSHDLVSSDIGRVRSVVAHSCGLFGTDRQSGNGVELLGVLSDGRVGCLTLPGAGLKPQAFNSLCLEELGRVLDVCHYRARRLIVVRKASAAVSDLILEVWEVEDKPSESHEHNMPRVYKVAGRSVRVSHSNVKVALTVSRGRGIVTLCIGRRRLVSFDLEDTESGDESEDAKE